MIGYRVSRRELRRQIAEQAPDWLSEAERGEEPVWGDIKDVFARIQHFKCGYCERPMPRPQRRIGDDDAGNWGGRREHDVEHFRPKGSVKRWPKEGSPLQYEFDTGDGLVGGYSWLAHDCLNYLVSCKTCNQDNKKDYFPIAGHRGEACSGVRRLNDQELPFLVNPVGAGDARPEELVCFHGVLATPRGARGHKRRRGRIIIDFFGLNLRDDLILQRCNLVIAMWPYLELARTGSPPEREDAARELDRLTKPAAYHANCARCFRDLHARDLAAAQGFYAAARQRSERLIG